MSNGRAWGSSLGNNKSVDNSWSSSGGSNKWGSSGGSGDSQTQHVSNYGATSNFGRNNQQVTHSTQTRWGARYNEHLHQERLRESNDQQQPEVNCCPII